LHFDGGSHRRRRQSRGETDDAETDYEDTPMAGNDNLLGTKNEQRIIFLEKNVNTLWRALWALIITSYTTLGSIVTLLAVTLIKSKS
tara:strand:+ start:414 stop:674 length:261 start_codon:yes stop_codon:yes gene_type:complete